MDPCDALLGQQPMATKEIPHAHVHGFANRYWYFTCPWYGAG